jgi:hypothetical protein
MTVLMPGPPPTGPARPVRFRKDPDARPLVGLQIGAISFVDEGVTGVLDTVVDKAAVNALFVATQSFDRGLQGRQISGRPWPGHGPSELDHHGGGSYVAAHPEYYAGTLLAPHLAPDEAVAGRDVLDDVIGAAHERDVAVYAFLLENTHSGLTRAVPNWPKVLQVDCYGRRDPYACVRNPDYVAWWLSVLQDTLAHHPLDGVMFGAERNGPLGNVLAGGGFARDGMSFCFCVHCEAAGAARGIDPRRAREGYVALDRLVRGTAENPNGHSALVQFLALLLRYPEIVAWESLWQDGMDALKQQLYGAAKFLAPSVQVGWHVWHENSFSPLYRAQNDFAAMTEWSDFVKPVLYHNCAGHRLRHHIDGLRHSLFRGISEQTVYDLVRESLGYDEAVPVESLPGRGLSVDYVRRETERTVAAVGGRSAVYPGLDVGVPTPPEVKQTDEQQISAAVRATLGAGADGYILSRKYSEMRLEYLAAAGDAVREVVAS